MRGSCIAGFWTQRFSTIYMDNRSLYGSANGEQTSGLINFDSVR